jgi:hypothetical protein
VRGQRRSLKVVNGGEEAVKCDLWGLAPRPPGFIALLPGLIWTAGASWTSPPINPGPGVGAQVASLRCPILRPGHRRV